MWRKKYCDNDQKIKISCDDRSVQRFKGSGPMTGSLMGGWRWRSSLLQFIHSSDLTFLVFGPEKKKKASVLEEFGPTEMPNHKLEESGMFVQGT